MAEPREFDEKSFTQDVIDTFAFQDVLGDREWLRRDPKKAMEKWAYHRYFLDCVANAVRDVVDTAPVDASDLFVLRQNPYSMPSHCRHVVGKRVYGAANT